MRDVMAAAAEAAATLALAGLLVMVMASTPTTMAVAMITAWRCLSLARCDLRGRGRPAPCASCVPSRAHTRPPSSRWRRSTAASGGALGSETAGFESGPGATRSSPPCSLLHSLLHSLLGSWLVGRWSGAASRSWRRRSFSCLSRSFSSLRIAFSLSSSMPPSSSSEKAGEDGHELGQDWMLKLESPCSSYFSCSTRCTAGSAATLAESSRRSKSCESEAEHIIHGDESVSAWPLDKSFLIKPHA
mmetsp:Transcript_43906/g.105548  ORF Transcript_43906/g.105548 Transcript_43906/m.105548 type:complete len:245 (-) Transcript_43906:186-920(-)